MSFADWQHRRSSRWLACALVWVLASCGGNSVETTTRGGARIVALATPTGTNTTEIVVDSGPDAGFSFGAPNIAYVTVTVCSPGSAIDCVTIDHVLLDTGSIGLRLMKSKVAGLSLPEVAVPADAVHATPAGAALECYPFVLGGLWGSMVNADLRIAGEMASSLPVQLIDDSAAPLHPAPADCVNASNGGLLNSVAMLQANGVLGIGMLAYDCGLSCVNGSYSALGYTMYYSCSASSCVPAALPSALQTQNPVVHFETNNNGTIIALPELPELGAEVAKGRLVFGIGTQANNQITPEVQLYFVDPDPKNPTYLYQTVQIGGVTYPYSYLDTGSNALFFEDAGLSKNCASSSGTQGGWYCPASVASRTATFSDYLSNSGQVNFSIFNADALFSTSSMAFANLGGSVNQGTDTFVGGLPLYYGRTVYTSIWNPNAYLDLSPNGPWNAF